MIPTIQSLPENAITVSPSQYSMWNDCEMAWDFNYVQNLKRKGTKQHFEIGTGVHDLCHIYFQVIEQGYVPGEPDLRMFMMDRMQEYLDDINASDIEEGTDKVTIIHSVTSAFMRYMSYQSPKIDIGIKPVGIEYELKIDTGLVIDDRPVYAHGFIDLLYMQGKSLLLRDHKTGANPRYHSQNKVEANSQLLFYNAFLDLVGVNIAAVEISFIHTKPSKTNTKDHFGFYRHAHNAESLKNYREQVLDSIRDMYSSKPKRRNRTDNCTGCSYWEICKHEVRGQTTNGIRSSQFQPVKRGPRLSIQA